METTAIQYNLPSRYFWLFVLIGLPVLGWYNLLDDYSSEDINTSISSAGLIYATARGINALVSLLQGTEFSIPFLTFSIGEVLDPVNDLIERFSEVILIALGSLALQKILLTVVSHTIFNVLLSIVALSTGLSFFLGTAKLQRILLRTFLIVAFFRFSLGLVVLANGWVDATFLDEADRQRHSAMENFQSELSQIDSLSRKAEQAAAEFSDAESRLAQLELKRKKIEREMRTIDAEILEADERLQEQSNTAGGLCAVASRTPILSPTCPESVKQQARALETLRIKRGEIVENIAEIDSSIDYRIKEMTCLENRQRGEKCHFWEILPDAPNIAMLQKKMNDIESGVSDFAQNTIDLLVSLLLKTVAIPVLFIYLLLKIVRMNWANI